MGNSEDNITNSPLPPWILKYQNEINVVGSLLFLGTLVIGIVATVWARIENLPSPAIFVLLFLILCGGGCLAICVNQWREVKIRPYLWSSIIIFPGLIFLVFEFVPVVPAENKNSKDICSQTFVTNNFNCTTPLTLGQIAKLIKPEPEKIPPSGISISKFGNQNLIRDGNFEIPFPSRANAWGNGFHVDPIKIWARNPAIKWINFINADVMMSVEKTVNGHALKISHKSNTEGGKCAVLEQYIFIPQTGTYRLSFDVKGENLEKKALILVTTDEWKRDPKHGGFEFEKDGTFEWTHISQDVELNSRGTRTFTLASIAKGTIWLNNLSLQKVGKK